ncbi:Protein disulfide isomerase-like 1-5 [Glycine max]|nr:Protein disulfide isomerase-like 1-5 [Glycine max]
MCSGVLNSRPKCLNQLHYPMSPITQKTNRKNHNHFTSSGISWKEDQQTPRNNSKKLQCGIDGFPVTYRKDNEHIGWSIHSAEFFNPINQNFTKINGAFTMNKILEFVDYNKFPLVTKLTEMNSIRVFSSPIKLQVTFISKFNLH